MYFASTLNVLALSVAIPQMFGCQFVICIEMVNVYRNA